jgi:GTPase SAR1 family protein
MSLDNKVVNIDGQPISLFIWDTDDHKKFFALTKVYFKKVDGVLIVFDVNSHSSFERIIDLMAGIDKYWIEQIKEKSDEDCVEILLGN